MRIPDDAARAFAEEWIESEASRLSDDIVIEGDRPKFDTDAARARLSWIDLLRGWLNRPVRAVGAS